jgi:glycosyltransferase involved in cell wall biosynthesis
MCYPPRRRVETQENGVVTVRLVIPCFNEQGRLAIEDFVRGLDEQQDLEFLFVDDGSTDNTLQLLRGICAQWSGRVEVLPLTPNCGKAEAVRRGVLAGLERRPEFIGYWDADLATPLAALRDFLHVFANRAAVELVMGSRVQLLGRAIIRSPVRHYAGRVFATFASLTLALPVYDTQCGAKLFRVTPQTIGYFTEPFLSRWIFDVEILARMHLGPGGAGGDRVYELALRRWEDVAGSKVRPLDFFRACRDLVRIRRWYAR